MYWFNNHKIIKTVTLWWKFKYEHESQLTTVVFANMSNEQGCYSCYSFPLTPRWKHWNYSIMREAKVMRPETTILLIHHADLSGPWPGWRMSLLMTPEQFCVRRSLPEPSSDVRVTLINGLFMQIKLPRNVWECPLLLGAKCIKVSSYHNFQPL